METIAFIGLGIMGSPMAVNLQAAGYEVVGFNRSPEKAHDLLQAGGRAAESVGEAVEGADVIATMVPDSSDVLDVLGGADGVLEKAGAGAHIIDFSTIRPDVTIELAQEAKSRGLRFLDAPVSGGEAGAQNAALSIMVGGEAADVEAMRAVFEAVGETVEHVGKNGAGQTVKAANQMLVAGNIALVAEALEFLQASEVDTEAALTVLRGGLAGSTVLQQKANAMLEGSFDPGFRSELHHKDLGIATSAAREAGVVVPVTALVSQLMASLVATGRGGEDHSALMRVIGALSGGGDAPPPNA